MFFLIENFGVFFFKMVFILLCGYFKIFCWKEYEKRLKNVGVCYWYKSESKVVKVFFDGYRNWDVLKGNFEVFMRVGYRRFGVDLGEDLRSRD